jgi:hypothetical protein
MATTRHHSSGQKGVWLVPRVAPHWGAPLGPAHEGETVVREAVTGEPWRRKQGSGSGGIPKRKWIGEGVRQVALGLLYSHATQVGQDRRSGDQRLGDTAAGGHKVRVWHARMLEVGRAWAGALRTKLVRVVDIVPCGYLSGITGMPWQW